MRYCARCGKEIKDTDGVYCDECFGVVVAMKVNGDKNIYKKVKMDKKTEDRLPDRNPDVTPQSVKPHKYTKEIENRSYFRLFLGAFTTLLGVLSFAIMSLFSAKISTGFILVGAVLVVVGVIEILKEKVLPRDERIASIVELATLAMGIILLLVFILSSF